MAVEDEGVSLKSCLFRYKTELRSGPESTHVKGLMGVSLPSAHHASQTQRFGPEMPFEIQSVACCEGSDRALIGATDFQGNVMITKSKEKDDSGDLAIKLKPRSENM